MAFVAKVFPVRGLARSIHHAYRNPFYSKTRWYSKKLCVGPAPTDVLKVGDPAFDYFCQNIERVRAHGRMTYLTPEQMSYLERLPAGESQVLKQLIEDLIQTNKALFRQVEQLLNNSTVHE